MTKRVTLLLLLLFLGGVSRAQSRRYSTANAHAHNDYLNKNPFYEAFGNGFGSIEVDVFPGPGTLYVAHSKREIDTNRTIDLLYLQPLAAIFKTSGTRPALHLLVDIKENYRVTLPLLIDALQPLRPYLSAMGRPGLTITISGNRPPPAEYRNYPDYIFFDDDQRQSHTSGEWNRVSLVSLSFSRLSQWKGAGQLPQADRRRLRHTIDSVHAAGKPIRFWAAPDNKRSWKWQRRLGTDLIGTDRVVRLARWLNH